MGLTNVMMRESWGNLLIVFQIHLFLTLIWIFLTKYGNRNPIYHSDKFPQICIVETDFRVKWFFDCIWKYNFLSLYDYKFRSELNDILIFIQICFSDLNLIHMLTFRIVSNERKKFIICKLFDMRYFIIW